MASPFLDTLLEGCGGSGIYYGSVLLSILIYNDGCLSWGHRIVASFKSALFSSLEMCMCEKEINVLTTEWYCGLSWAVHCLYHSYFIVVVCSLVADATS